MSQHIYGSINLKDFAFDNEKFKKQIDTFTENYPTIQTDYRNVGTVALANELYSTLLKEAMGGMMRRTHIVIYVKDQLQHVLVSIGNTAFFACSGAGQITFLLSGMELAKFTTEDTLFTVSKKALKNKLTENTTYFNDIIIVKDPNNYMVGIDDPNQRERHLLESTADWLKRKYSKLDDLKDVISRLVIKVKLAASEAEDIDEEVPDATTIFANDTKGFYIGSTIVQYSIAFEHIKALYPKFGETFLEYALAKKTIGDEIGMLCVAENELDQYFLLALEGKSAETKICYTSNTPTFTAKDSTTDIWSSCRFLGSIGFDKDGKTVYYDCGIWIGSGDRISATFVDSDDHTKYHSLPLAANGKLLDTFKAQCEANAGTTLTAINLWIAEAAKELNYYKD